MPKTHFPGCRGQRRVFGVRAEPLGEAKSEFECLGSSPKDSASTPNPHSSAPHPFWRGVATTQEEEEEKMAEAPAHPLIKDFNAAALALLKRIFSSCPNGSSFVPNLPRVAELLGGKVVAAALDRNPRPACELAGIYNDPGFWTVAELKRALGFFSKIAPGLMNEAYTFNAEDRLPKLEDRISAGILGVLAQFLINAKLKGKSFNEYGAVVRNFAGRIGCGEVVNPDPPVNFKFARYQLVESDQPSRKKMALAGKTVPVNTQRPAAAEIDGLGFSSSDDDDEIVVEVEDAQDPWEAGVQLKRQNLLDSVQTGIDGVLSAYAEQVDELKKHVSVLEQDRAKQDAEFRAAIQERNELKSENLELKEKLAELKAAISGMRKFFE